METLASKEYFKLRLLTAGMNMALSLKTYHCGRASLSCLLDKPCRNSVSSFALILELSWKHIVANNCVELMYRCRTRFRGNKVSAIQIIVCVTWPRKYEVHLRPHRAVEFLACSTNAGCLCKNCLLIVVILIKIGVI